MSSKNMISGFIHYKTGDQKDKTVDQKEIYFESITHDGVTTILNHKNDDNTKYMLPIENNTQNSEIINTKIINTIINNSASKDIQNDLQNDVQNVRNELIKHISGATFTKHNGNDKSQNISIIEYLRIILKKKDDKDDKEFESYINALYFILNTENINLITSFITCIQPDIQTKQKSYIDLERCFQNINIKKVFFFKFIFDNDNTNTITQTIVNNKVLTKPDVTSDFTETINTLLNGPNDTTKKEKINYLIDQFTQSEPSNQFDTKSVRFKTTDDVTSISEPSKLLRSQTVTNLNPKSKQNT